MSMHPPRRFCIALLAVVALLGGWGASEARRYDIHVTSANLLFVTPDSSAWVLRVELPRALQTERLDYALLDLTLDTSVSLDQDAVFAFRVTPLDQVNVEAKSFVAREGNWPGQTLVSNAQSRTVRLEVTRLLREWQRTGGVLEVAVERRDQNERVHMALSGPAGRGISGTLRLYITGR